ENIRRLLDSTAEAIFGIDTQGICTFCNPSCLTMLGYKEKKDLIGKKMHDLISNRQSDERPIAFEDSQIFQTLTQGEGAHSTDQVFWRADGSCFPVEYFSFPQFHNGEVVGSVITFFDITERKKSEEEIMHLSYRDQLTGLYNRRFFEEELERKDVKGNYPLTIVFADMNGLKLINDSFGHTMGDRLLNKVAKVLLKGCRSNDILARLGGDEFVILLPKTGPVEAEKIVRRIKKIAATEAVDSIEVSISCGFASKTHREESIQEVLKKAEDRMYQNKLFESPGIKERMVQVVLNTLYAKDPKEKEHSQKVSEWCQQTGKVLGLSGPEIEVLKWAGLYHDIGKVAIKDRIWRNAGTLNEDEWKEIKRHSEIGYRFLSTVNDMSELAEYLLAHHERWDGQGYPKGLRGEDIPLQSRIVAVIEAYDFMTNERIHKNALSQSEAIGELYKNAGKQFDPTIVEAFVEKVLNK
ncbi:MAG TPA: HD domain-containing phosphohydrolase, partial [Bacillota bacterium]|nr:HD domain-containing phosphohydrolase [Bacillota bacterium]